MSSLDASRLRACHSCGLVVEMPATPVRGQVARCPRCADTIKHARAPRSCAWAASFALAALILYPLAMALPVLEIEQMGHMNKSTIWSGVVSMAHEGRYVIAGIIFVCSIVIPLGKVFGIFALCARPGWMERSHQVLAYRAIDWLGKWGMIDVLLVAVLVAAVKLGDWVDVHPGPGALAFALVVGLSMLSSATFDPASIWEEQG